MPNQQRNLQATIKQIASVGKLFLVGCLSIVVFVLGALMVYIIVTNILPDPGVGVACAYTQTDFIDCIVPSDDPSWDIGIGSILNGAFAIFLIYISLKGVRYTISRTTNMF